MAQPGDQIRVPEGPFKDFTGEVVSVEGDRVRLIVDVFGRSSPVEISLSDFGEGRGSLRCA